MNPMNPFDVLGLGLPCFQRNCRKVTVVYVPNLAKEDEGREFDSPQHLLLARNINYLDYPHETVVK